MRGNHFNHFLSFINETNVLIVTLIQLKIRNILKISLCVDFRSVLFCHANFFCHDLNSMSVANKSIFLSSDEYVYFYTAKICYDILLKVNVYYILKMYTIIMFYN